MIARGSGGVTILYGGILDCVLRSSVLIASSISTYAIHIISSIGGYVLYARTLFTFSADEFYMVSNEERFKSEWQ